MEVLQEKPDFEILDVEGCMSSVNSLSMVSHKFWRCLF